MDTLQGLYDEDRSVTITGKNGEISIRVGNQEPIVVTAMEFSDVSLAAIVEATR